jgi:hypothetical protein
MNSIHTAAELMSLDGKVQAVLTDRSSQHDPCSRVQKPFQDKVKAVEKRK